MAAEQLLANPVLQQAFKAIEDDLLRQFRAVDLKDSEAHTRLVLAYQTSHAVGRHLWQLIQDGHAATAELNMRGRRID